MFQSRIFLAYRLLCSQAAHARPNLYLSVVRFEYYFLNRLLKVFDRFKMYVSYALRVKGNEIIGMLSDTVSSLSDIIRYSLTGRLPGRCLLPVGTNMHRMQSAIDACIALKSLDRLRPVVLKANTPIRSAYIWRLGGPQPRLECFLCT
jgi:hypothetical protein